MLFAGSRNTKSHLKNKMEPKVSIIILNWNGLFYTRRCLRSLQKTDYSNYQVIVVDNGSDKNEADILKKEFGLYIRLIKNKVNLGFAEGNNTVLRKARNKYIVLLNNDTEVDPSWLRELVKVMEKNPGVGACQPKIKSLKDPDFFDYAGAAGGFIDILGYPLARGRLFQFVEKDIGQYDDSIEIFWASGTAMMIRRSILSKVGYLDPLFFAYAEEVDLCWRIHRAGFKVIYVPNALVFHLGGATSNRNLVRKMFLVHRNHLILLLKNYSLMELLFLFPIRMGLELMTYFYYLFTRRLTFVNSLLQAHVSVLLSLPLIFEQRKFSQSVGDEKNCFVNSPPWFRGSIIYEYYIKRHRTYQEVLGRELKKHPCLKKMEDLLALKGDK